MTQWLWQTDFSTRKISDISRYLTFMALVIPPPILHRIVSVFSGLASLLAAVRKSFRFLTQRLLHFKKSRSERRRRRKKNSLIPFCGAVQFSCPQGYCRRNVHFHLYLTAHCLRQTPMYVLSIIRPGTCQITAKSVCAALKCFAGTRCLFFFCFFWIHDQIWQLEWWNGLVCGGGQVLVYFMCKVRSDRIWSSPQKSFCIE